MEIIRQRDNLVDYLKVFIENTVKKSYGDVSAIEKLVQSIVPTVILNDDDNIHNMPNPIIPILVEALYNELRKVKEAAEQQKDKDFMKKE